MNKGVDQRILPEGEYIDATNVRINSSGDNDEIGAVQNVKGSRRLTELEFNGARISFDAVCIGAFSDDTKETIYWFVHDPGGTNAAGATVPAVDMIVSYNMNTDQLLYHVISISILNFDPKHLITGVDKIGDLLFFTDDLNPPRRINVTRHYLFPTGSPLADNVTEDDISVIVKPPLAPPTINMIETGAEENFIEDKMLSFAYRYRYLDGEYSALSSFSELAYEAKEFVFDRATYDNEGMVNHFNAAEVTFNTGDKRVTDIQLCYKISDSNSISIVQNYDKAELGYPDNVEKTIVFDNSKAYAALPPNQLARAFDNVPLKAKGQTISGNRLVYGNYHDGRDLVDENDDKVKINYTAQRKIATGDVFKTSATISINNADYNIEGSTKQLLNDAAIDFSGMSLKKGNVFSLLFTFTRNAGKSSYSTTVDEPNTFQFEINYRLPRDHTSVHDLFTSEEYIRTSGFDVTSTGSTNINSILPSNVVTDNKLCNFNTTFTDAYMCAYESSRSRAGLSIIGNGIEALGVNLLGSLVETRQIKFTSTAGSNVVNFTFPAFKLNDTSTDSFEYFDITNVDFFSSQGARGNKSLHSNRDYDLGIVYLDDHNRATTVLTSEDNTVYVPASGSDEINKIRVTIPTSQKPPAWANKYKFFLKSSEGDYETIYSDVVYVDPTDGTSYFKLDGDNQNKMKVGDVLTVKADSTGALDSLSKVTVLDIQAFANNEIPGNTSSLKGLYMSLNPGNEMSVEKAGTDVVNMDVASQAKTIHLFQQGIMRIRLYDQGFSDIPINAGDRVSLKIVHKRAQTTNNCKSIRDEFIMDNFVAISSYDNFQDFFNNHNGGISWSDIKTSSGATSLDIDYDSATGTYSNNNFGTLGVLSSSFAVATNVNIGNPLVNSQVYSATSPEGKHRFQFVNNTSVYGNGLELWTQCGLPGCRRGKPAVTKARIQIIRNSGLYIFETQAEEISSEIYYEGNEVFDIATDGANKLIHKGNVQDQNTASLQSAISDLNFHNCFTFFNGVESMKVRDRVVGRKFFIGERVSIESDTEYKDADRFASLSYSGVFNDETNYNALNEFNLSDINYKDLDKNFGAVMVLSDRTEDILVLQEDRISRVLVSKNILSDTSGNELLSKSNNFLGNQLPRPEEFGISRNAESFAKYGYDYYFTDAKRGAVVRVSGTGARGDNDQVAIVSNVGMRSYFRDNLKESINKINIGEYDSHSQEYVLSSTDSSLPEPTFVEPCNIIMTKKIEAVDATSSTRTTKTQVDLGNTIGSVAIAVTISDIKDFVVSGSVTDNPTVKLTGTATDTGVPSKVSANKLIDEGQTFSTSVSTGDMVRVDNTTKFATISSIDSNTTLTLSSDIILSGEAYSVISSELDERVVDSKATFVTSGVDNSCQFKNKRTGQTANVTVVVSETEIVLASAIFTVDDPYEITKAVTTGITPTIKLGGVTQGGSGSAITSSSTYTFSKSSSTPNLIDLDITYPGPIMGTFTVSAPCPTATSLNVTYIVLSSNESADAQLGYAFSRTESGGFSALEGGQFVLSSGTGTVVSEFIETAGLPGNGVIPASGDTLRMAAFNSESFTLDDMTAAEPVHRFRILETSAQYTASDIQTILADSELKSPTSISANSAGDGYFADFDYVRGVGENYLYLIWDLRNVNQHNFYEVAPASSISDNLETVCCSTGGSPTARFVDANDERKVTGVFTDRNLSTSVANGVYARGAVGGSVGYLINSGALSDILECPTCAISCSGFDVNSGTIISEQQTNIFPIDVTSATGAVVIRIKPNRTESGALSNTDYAGMLVASLGTSTFNSCTSSLVGFIDSFWSHNGIISPLPSSGNATIPFVLNQYDGSTYTQAGTQNIVVNSADVTAATGGAEYVMVVPKTSASPSRLLLNFFSVKSQFFNITAACPAALPSFQIAGPITVYHSTFTGGTGGTPARFNHVFTDANGTTKLAAGTYNTVGVTGVSSIVVDANGIITTVNT
tara:strand:+ start:10671 stop:16595 length:5925 start_codon:yes stop_codon:yes gene_type:complete